jgi:hypothetical protein
MTDSVQHVWVIPSDPQDMAPLPALQDGELGLLAVYDRKEKAFDAFELAFGASVHATFDGCRMAMINARTAALNEAREHARHVAATIEHIRNLPVAAFPSHALHDLQQQQEEAVQEEAQAEEVKPAKAELKRPSRRGNASN